MRRQTLIGIGIALMAAGGALWLYCGSILSQSTGWQSSLASALDSGYASRLVMYGNLQTIGAVGAGAGVLLIILGLAVDSGAPRSSGDGALRACPECAELIRVEATKCRWCGSRVDPLVSGEGSGEIKSRIAQLKTQLAGLDAEDRDPLAIFDLGRQYALLFDETGEGRHRAAALKYMTAALESDPDCLAGDDGFYLREFGSLESDPEFAALLER